MLKKVSNRRRKSSRGSKAHEETTNGSKAPKTKESRKPKTRKEAEKEQEQSTATSSRIKKKINKPVKKSIGNPSSTLCKNKTSTVEEATSTTPATPGTPGSGGFIDTSTLRMVSTTPSSATSASSTPSVVSLPETKKINRIGGSVRKQKTPIPNAVPDAPVATSVKNQVTTSTTGSGEKWSGEGVAKAWLDKVDFAKAKSDFDKIQGLIVNVEKECKKWKANAKLNQSDDYPALDSNLVKLENEYVNMSQVDVSLTRPVLMGQLPVKGSEETFWKAVFEKRATSIHILIGDESIDFFPQKTEDYKNYGQMWVNNRRVEVINKDLSRFLIEVLPHGCSNSIVCNVTVIRNWSIDSVHEKQAVVVKETIELTSFLTQSLNEETALIVSHHGAGRAGYFLALAVALNKLEAKTEPCIADTVKTIRTQRPKAVESLLQYVSLHIALMYYIKKKMAKGVEGDKKATVNNLDPLTKKAIEVSLQFETALIAETAQPSLMGNTTTTTTSGSTVSSLATSAKM